MSYAGCTVILCSLFFVATSASSWSLAKTLSRLPHFPTASQSSPPNANCESLPVCAQWFIFGPLNVSFSPSVAEFGAQIDAYIERNGVSGFHDFCNSIRNFIHCLGEDADVCTKAEVWARLGCDAQNAIGYEVITRESTYECQEYPEKVLADNFDCIKTVDKTYASYELQCQATFQKEMAMPLTLPQMCQYLNEFVACFDMPFLSNCGKEVAKVSCESAAVGIFVTAPQCSMYCEAYGDA